jgi:DNA mismatch repair enzyme (predicted ATPase)
MDYEDYPLAFSFRFIGRKIAVDLGGLATLGFLGEGLPMPIINFTYHI